MPQELAVDLRHAAMLGVAQDANQRDDVKAELALRQSEGAFLLQLVRVAIGLALGICAAADDQPQSHQPIERSDGSEAVVGKPQPPGASMANFVKRLEPDLGGGLGARMVS
jgi:hypothetical protein